MTSPPHRAPDGVWWGWGTADRHEPLGEGTRRLLQTALHVPYADTPAVDEDAVRLPDGRLTEVAAQALEVAVGSGAVHRDPAARLRHTAGRSSLDLLRLREGDARDAPDAVVLPGSHDDVQAVLAVAVEHRLAVIPWGGGTSVVGGLAADSSEHAGRLALDLRRLDRLLAVDPVSRTARFEAGVRGPEAEALLAPHGLALGHLPQSWEHASLGGYAVTRSSGQASSGYGRFDAMVQALRVATPRGGWELGRAPASAAGPDLRQLVLGSEGAFGIVTEVVVRVHPLPEVTRYEAWQLPDLAAGVEVLRRLAQDGPLPVVARLSDEVETALGLARGAAAGPGAPSVQPGGCQLVTGLEGTAAQVARQQGELAAVLGEAGAVPLGEAAGEAWRAGRYEGPYTRDALLDAGALVETMESATSWSGLLALHAAVGVALTASLTAAGAPPLVSCHVSHLYPAGASLYWTVVSARAEDPASQWRSAKSAALQAIVAAGATITHHHGVGVDHRPWLAAEVGELGVEVLQAIKGVLDPTGILNPGVLLPPAGR